MKTYVIAALAIVLSACVNTTDPPTLTERACSTRMSSVTNVPTTCLQSILLAVPNPDYKEKS